ncbi:hypothetical protein OSTOST_21296 [Ostertagia ostertagi]
MLINGLADKCSCVTISVLIQRLTCRANKSNADTFVQFNRGAGGFLVRGEQVVDIQCTSDGHWRFARSDSKSIAVESLAWLPTTEVDTTEL